MSNLSNTVDYANLSTMLFSIRNFPDELQREAKVEAARVGISLRQFMIECVQARLGASTDSNSGIGRKKSAKRITTQSMDIESNPVETEVVKPVEAVTESSEKPKKSLEGMSEREIRLAVLRGEI